MTNHRGPGKCPREVETRQNAIVRRAGSHGRMVVSPLGNDSCSTCGGRKGCGFLCPSDAGSREMEVLDPVGASPGDIVEIELPPGRAVLLISLFFLLPVAGLLAGLLLGSGGSAGRTALAALLGGAAGMIVGLAVSSRLSRDEGFAMRTVSIVGRAPAGGVGGDPAGVSGTGDERSPADR